MGKKKQIKKMKADRRTVCMEAICALYLYGHRMHPHVREAFVNIIEFQSPEMREELDEHGAEWVHKKHF